MRFYCEYCKSYLTHDRLSVRKSHLQGKNHVKHYCDYYVSKAQELGIDVEKCIELVDVVGNAPGFELGKFTVMGKEMREFKLPPPNTIKGFANPPPSVYHNDQDKLAVLALINKE